MPTLCGLVTRGASIVLTATSRSASGGQRSGRYTVLQPAFGQSQYEIRQVAGATVTEAKNCNRGERQRWSGEYLRQVSSLSINKFALRGRAFQRRESILTPVANFRYDIQLSSNCQKYHYLYQIYRIIQSFLNLVREVLRFKFRFSKLSFSMVRSSAHTLCLVSVSVFCMYCICIFVSLVWRMHCYY